MGFLPLFSTETWTLLALLVCLFVVYGHSSYGVFERMGVPCLKPAWYFGTVGRLDKVYFLDDLMHSKKFGKIWGIYELKSPMLAVMNPVMIKTILVKECFSHFTNRRNLRLNGDLYDAIFIAEDDNWRRIRNILSPSFTSGRIKDMFSIMQHHSRRLTDGLSSKVHNDEVITLKDHFGTYSLDVMASCAFSVDIDSRQNASDPFTANARELFRVNIPLFLLQGMFPFLIPLLNVLGFSLFPKSSTKFFESILRKVKAERQNNSRQGRVDFLQLMFDSQKGDDPKGDDPSNGLSDHEILSQSTIFIVAGYETSGTALTFLAYNLARNPHVMRRLQEEIDATFPNKSPVQYEALMHMEYLDCVINESLRLYPPAPRLERVAKTTVEINGTTIPKGMNIMIPTYALHRDPDLWPEPEDFNPDRFSKENRESIDPYIYLPFGAGPRNCIGMRFALVAVKLALVEVLRHYSFSVCEETEIPVEMDVLGLLGPKRPIKMKLVARSTASEN